MQKQHENLKCGLNVSKKLEFADGNKTTAHNFYKRKLKTGNLEPIAFSVNIDFFTLTPWLAIAAVKGVPN